MRIKTLMLEQRSKPLISKTAFAGRLLQWLLITFILLIISLLTGVIGYRYFENMPWIDALLNAAMILGGMGEITELHTTGGKLFAACYAIYCGIFLIICGGLLLVPVFHRLLHRFHGDQ